jgi:hypothetical protein
LERAKRQGIKGERYRERGWNEGRTTTGTGLGDPCDWHCLVVIIVVRRVVVDVVDIIIEKLRKVNTV